jgi:hypothetical protein
MENECQDIVTGPAHSKTKEDTTHRVKASATLGSLSALTERKTFIVCILLCVMMWKKKAEGSTPGPNGNLLGNRLGQEALTRDQRDRLQTPCKPSHGEER